MGWQTILCSKSYLRIISTYSSKITLGPSILFHTDTSIVNPRTGLGTNRDKSLRDSDNYHDLYDNSDIAQRMVDLEPYYGTKNWVTLEPKDIDFKKFKVRQIVKSAWQKARLDGVAYIFVNAQNHDISSELKIDETFKVNNLLVLSKKDIKPLIESISKDIKSDIFGRPTEYSDGNNNIHHTRLIMFEGEEGSQETYIKNGYSNQSVLARRIDAIQNYDAGMQGISHLMQEFRTLVFSFEDYNKTSDNSDKKKKLLDRIRKIQEGLGLYNILLKSSKEEYKYLTTETRGAVDLVDMLKNRLQAASPNIPHTLLFNENPGEGLSGHGGSQKIAWYDYISSQQETYLRPKLDRLFEVLLASSDYKIKWEDFSYSFNPLYHESKGDKAEREYKNAQRDSIYLSQGIVEPKQIAETLTSIYPSIKPVKQ